ncbi:MAG: hypothetical protein MPJ50_05960, partial [Pirellulales bacterium]|nr:hypothetical protein [Pirellulales bacterium]
VLDTPEEFRLQKLVESKDPFSFIDELELERLPSAVQSALRKFPYGFQFRGPLFLVDFDSRIMREESFRESFDQMCNSLPRISSMT